MIGDVFGSFVLHVNDAGLPANRILGGLLSARSSFRQTTVSDKRLAEIWARNLQKGKGNGEMLAAAKLPFSHVAPFPEAPVLSLSSNAPKLAP